MAIEVEVVLTDEQIDGQIKSIAERIRREFGAAAPNVEFSKKIRETFGKIPTEARGAAAAAAREFERAAAQRLRDTERIRIADEKLAILRERESRRAVEAEERLRLARERNSQLAIAAADRKAQVEQRATERAIAAQERRAAAEQREIVRVSAARERDAARVARAEEREAARATNAQRQSERATLQHAQALARLQASTGNYTAAVTTLSSAQLRLATTSTAYLQVQRQIADLQARQERASRNESLNRLTQNAKEVDALSGKLRILSSVAQLAAGSAGLGPLDTVIGSLSGKTGVYAGAIVAAGTAVVGLTLKSADYARQVDNAARVTGLSTQTIQALSIEASRVGQNFNDVTDAVNQLATQIGDARNGSDELRKVFQRVGVDIKNTSLTTSQVLDQVLRRLAAMPPSIEKTVIASRLFGEEGARLILALQNTEGGLASLTSKYEKLGAVVDSDGIQKAKQFSQELGILQAKVETVGVKLGVAFTPFISSFVRDIDEGINAVNRLASALDGLRSFFRGGAGNVGSLLDLTIFNGELGAESIVPGVGPLRRFTRRIPGVGQAVDTITRAGDFIGSQFVTARPRLDVPTISGLTPELRAQLIEQARTGRNILPTSSLLPPPPTRPQTARARGSRAARVEELPPEVESLARRVEIAFDLLSKDLPEVTKAYEENQARISALRTTIKIFEDSGTLKSQQAQKAIHDLVAAFDLGAELLGRRLTLLQQLPAVKDFKGILTVGPAPDLDGEGLLGANRRGGLTSDQAIDAALAGGFLLDRNGTAIGPQIAQQQAQANALRRLNEEQLSLYDSIAESKLRIQRLQQDDPLRDEAETLEVYARVLERARGEQLQFFETVVDSQARLSRLFEVNPLEIQARTLDALTQRVKSTSEIIADAQIGAMDSVFDFVDRGFDRLTQGLGAARGLISQILSDITRLFISRQFTSLFGGGGGVSFSPGSSGGVGSFIGGILGGARGGGAGAFLTPGFNGGLPLNLASLAGNGGSSISAPPSVSSLGAFSNDPLGLGRIVGGRASAARAGFGSLLGGALAPLAPILGLSLGSSLGGQSTAGRILGGIGGGFLGAGGGLALAGALGGGLSGGAASFASFALGPFGLAIGGALLLGSFLLGKAKQRGNDERLADSYWSAEAAQIQELTRGVNSDRIDGAEALAQAAVLRQQTIAQLNQIKTASVRESRLRNQLPDVDRVYVSQLRAAVERQSLRRRIGPQIIPEFAGGGWIQGVDRGYDSELLRGRPGELILNRRQQQQIQALAGPDVFRQAGVPGASGNQVQTSAPASSQPIELYGQFEVILGQGDTTEVVLRSMRSSDGRRVIVKTTQQAIRNREL